MQHRLSVVRHRRPARIAGISRFIADPAMFATFRVVIEHRLRLTPAEDGQQVRSAFGGRFGTGVEPDLDQRAVARAEFLHLLLADAVELFLRRRAAPFAPVHIMPPDLLIDVAMDAEIIFPA